MCLFLCLQMDILGLWRTDYEPKSFLARAECGTAITAIRATAGGGYHTTTTIFLLLHLPCKGM